jgi:hypothetical protein
MQHDAFSQWLGITVLEIRKGYSKIKMTVRAEMMNGFMWHMEALLSPLPTALLLLRVTIVTTYH